MIFPATLYYERLVGIEHYVHLLGRLRHLGAVPEASSVARTLVGRAALETRSRLIERLDWEIISLDGCVLSLAAQFELTVRDLIEWFANSAATKASKYSDLPKRIREQNIRLVGEFLKEFNASRVAHINYPSVVAQLAACTTIGSPVI